MIVDKMYNGQGRLELFNQEIFHGKIRTLSEKDKQFIFRLQ